MESECVLPAPPILPELFACYDYFQHKWLGRVVVTSGRELPKAMLETCCIRVLVDAIVFPFGTSHACKSDQVTMGEHYGKAKFFTNWWDERTNNS